MLLFQIIVATKTETLEYFTDIEDPISFGFINPRCHTIIETGIDAFHLTSTKFKFQFKIQNNLLSLITHW